MKFSGTQIASIVIAASVVAYVSVNYKGLKETMKH